MEEDVPIESGLITRRIAGAQKAVETQNFMARKHLLEYDDVMNKQRQAVYTMRRALLEGQEQKSKIFDIVAGIVGQFLDLRAPENQNESTWDLAGLAADILNSFGVTIDVAAISEMSRGEIEDHINEVLQNRYNDKESALGPDGADIMRQTERMVMLNVIDNQWKDHLLSMDHLKEGIGLRGYGQKDPLVEYKKESFTLFQDMMDRIEDETIKFLYFMNVQVEHTGPRGSMVPHPDIMEDDDYLIANGSESNGVVNGTDHGVDQREAQHALSDITRNIQRKKEKELAQLQFVGGDSTSTAQEPVIAGPKTGRNDPCPCGSGKKYKKCHGA
jgi:preprotein translocase subunit SecA